MYRFLAVLSGVLALSGSCTLFPNSVVRVALPAGDARAAEQWSRIAAALPSGPGETPFDLVAPDSFPPPDLVWFDGNFDNPDYLANALAPNREVEMLGTEAGLAQAWFGLAGDRILPLAWNPWSWWVTTPGSNLVAGTDADLQALRVYTQRTSPPSLGTTEGGAAVPEQRRGQVWLAWAAVQASPERTRLTLVPAEVLVTRVTGLWWSAKGWNQRAVPKALARLWSTQVQALWQADPAWLPAARSLVSSSVVRTLLVVR